MLDTSQRILSALSMHLPQEIIQRLQRLHNFLNQYDCLSKSEAFGQTGKSFICSVVEAAHDLSIFDKSRQWNNLPPTNESHILEQIWPKILKLSRYFLISRSLVDASRKRKYTIFQSIKVVGISPNLRLDSRINFASNRTLDHVLKDLSRKASNTPTIRKVRPLFASNLKEKADKSTIHAEIQLLYHYEATCTAHPPRLLCASKSACYLCQFFIDMHGKFSTPRTHGAIYNLWVIPSKSFGDSSAFATSFLRELDTHLARVVQKAIQSSNMRRMSNNESVAAFYPALSASTTVKSTAMTTSPSSVSSFARPPPADSDTHLHDIANVPTIIDMVAETQVFKEDISLASIPLDWSCFRLSGRNSVLSLQDDSFSLLIVSNSLGVSTRDLWVGVKSLKLQTHQSLCRTLPQVIDVNQIDELTTLVEAGSAATSCPLLLKVSTTLIVLKFSYDAPSKVQAIEQSRGVTIE